MRALFTFLRKEFTEGIRSKKTIIILVIFGVFGILNPLIAKITPLLIDVMSESLKDSGFEVVPIDVDALTSWMQFFKNIPMGLLAFVLLFGATFTHEYDKSTLVLVLTKGLARWKVVISKFVHLICVWTVGVLVCAAITAVYNQIYWDNSIAKHIVPGIALYWLFGCMIISALVLFSVIFSSAGAVLAATAGTYFVMTILQTWDKAAEVLPTKLCDGYYILQGLVGLKEFVLPAVVTTVVIFLCVVSSVVCFNRKEL